MAAVMGSAAVPRSVEAGQGVQWWRQAWALFTPQAGLWIVFGVVLMIGAVVLSMVPLLGGLAIALLTPVLVGGWMLAARKVAQGGSLALADLFVCFQYKLNPLLVLGALLLALTVVIGLVVGGLGMWAVLGLFMGGSQGSVGGVMAGLGSGMLALLVALGAGMLVSMVFWFAPALVVFHDIAPIDALKGSLSASLKNILPFFLYSLVYFVAALLASMLLGLGWLVLVPLLLLTVYVSYVDVYGA